MKLGVSHKVICGIKNRAADPSNINGAKKMSELVKIFQIR